MKTDAKPTTFLPRKVSFSLKEKFKESLDQLEIEKIIVKDINSAAWVNSLVLVRKPKTGSIRICLDPKYLNLAIKRYYFQIPTVEELTAKLSGSTIFNTLDATQGFLQFC